MTTNAFQVDEEAIRRTLGAAQGQNPDRVREVLRKALEMKGLDDREVSDLMDITDPTLLDELFHAAKKVKEEIYGNRIVLFAPLYASNVCNNECTYCAFRASNKGLVRRSLSQEEIAEETRAMIRTGQKRIVLLTGEAYPKEGLDYVLQCIKTIYATKEGKGEIRRINVEIAPLTVEDFKRLKEAEIGTYITVQETYHRETYEQVHLGGKKRNFDWRVQCMDRAMEGGIDDVGIGVLFGLYDWKFEVLALMQHANHLDQRFGCGPHTISIPRIEPAEGSEISEHPPFAVSDEDFKKIIAILRLAVPYTGIILSTRERPEIRRDCLELGVSQISAGSRTNPGGYGQGGEHDAQFSLGDHRSLDEVVRDLAEHGFMPSFCTGCYRLGRVGADFMDMAKPGDIKTHCQPNAVSTFVEFLEDYASPETVDIGWKVIGACLEQMPKQLRQHTEGMVAEVKAGQRDVFC
ncbi:MAG: [FeFe] hydrogenase H-cluster radical SAM maturase HydG [Firmicutes bacterium]|nr:[FeFe] hydrogenase H-cluster radical SAM maturase HydG [Bacillota bacterium]